MSGNMGVDEREALSSLASPTSSITFSLWVDYGGSEKGLKNSDNLGMRLPDRIK